MVERTADSLSDSVGKIDAPSLLATRTLTTSTLPSYHYGVWLDSGAVDSGVDVRALPLI